MKIIQIILEAIVQDRDDFIVITQYINNKITEMERENKTAKGRWLCMAFKQNYGGYKGALPEMNMLVRAGNIDFLLFYLH